MIVLLIILVVAAIGGVAAYVIMQYTGVLGLADEPRLRHVGGSGGGDPGRFSVPRRLDEVSQGCLVSVIVVMSVWILLWLVVLVVGLRVLLA